MSAVLINKRYRLDQEIGRGGMGVVFRAQDRLSGQAVALKRVFKSTDELVFTSTSNSINVRLALAQEFQLLASLRHPRIISVLDYGFDEEGLPYFTMDLLENPVRILQYGSGLSVQQKIDLLVQVLQALKYLHRRKIIHRDLKPANILVANGELKVLDFGLAIRHQTKDVYETSTSGTLAYMSPEVLNGAPSSEASDLYAVGVIAYELFAGKHPFHVDSITALMNDIVGATPDVSELSSALSPIVQRLLAKQPAERYRNADEVLAAFSQVAEQPLVLETSATRESFLQASQLVGRDEELAQLTDVLAQAISGQGSTWLIGGESGVGKSRLLDELRAQALVRGVLVLRGQEISEGGSSYQLWREILRWLSLFTPLNDTEAGILKAIAPDLDQLLERTIPEVPKLPPQAAQARLLGTINAIFQRQTQPVLIILEDIHWSSESLDVLKSLTGVVKQLPVLILATYRDDERADLPRLLPGANAMRLKRLSESSIAELSASMIGEAGRLPEVVNLLQRETEGNVFFVVEVVRALAEEAGQLDHIGVKELPEHIFAGGIKQIVQRRLNRIAPGDYPLLQLAAVLGKQLDETLLAASGLQPELERWLLDCANAAVLVIVDDRWRFSHDKLREGILADLSPEQQEALHFQTADLIERVYPGLAEYAPRLAYYWHMAGNAKKEQQYAILAGQQAHRSGAFVEAIRYFRRAIELLMAEPESTERNTQELNLQLDLGANLLAAKGYGSSEVYDTYERARQLCKEIGNAPQLFTVISGLNVFYVVRAKLKTAYELAQQALDLAEKRNDSTLCVEAYRMLAASTFWQGDFENSQNYMEKCYSTYDPEKHKGNLFTYGQDAAVTVLSNGGWLRWMQGYPEQGLQNSLKAVSIADSLKHSFSQCFGLAFLNNLYISLNDLTALEQGVARLTQIAAENDIKNFAVNALGQRGWLLCALGKPTEGLALLHKALDMFRMGSILNVPFTMALLAEAYLMNGQIDEASITIDNALALFPENEAQFYLGEMLRIKGEVLFRESPAAAPKAIECFREGLAFSRRIGARSLELRAAMSLYKLEGESARNELVSAYDCFTEGFNTHDLIKARALLAE